MAVYLPRINYMEVHGFDKIFKNNDIYVDFKSDLSILLGGNGLGKTTLLQCVIYALTGGLVESEVEKDKTYRWDYKFFKGRVYNDRLTEAYIIVNFNFGYTQISVKRGLQSNRVLEFNILSDNYNGKLESYDKVIEEYGGYDYYSDFIFIVNRLLYLPENRRSLTWDYDGQIRTLMVLSNDIIDENEYRRLRAEIKNLDSAKRHTIVKINKAKVKIEQANISLSSNIEDMTENEEDNEGSTVDVQHRIDLSRKVEELCNQRNNLSTMLKDNVSRRFELVEEIESVSESIRKAEASFVYSSLTNSDAVNSMIFGKIIEHGVCPCCGEISKEFQKEAKSRLSNGSCIICGKSQDNVMNTDTTLDEIEAFNSQLAEKLNARDVVNKNILHTRHELTYLDEQIDIVRRDLNTIEYEHYVNNNQEEKEYDDEDDISDVIQSLEKLQYNRTELEIEITKKTEQADAMFRLFKENFDERRKKLYEIYKDLATKFLGKSVTLEFEKSAAKFVDFEYLIPVFDNESRKTPEDCSEAQRFFLDIAFRMALIILNQKLTNTSATFICETPESALDVSYVNNVTKMFFGFIHEQNTLILTNNLQRLGLAYLLVENAKSAESKTDYVIFDLLEVGKLSDVQQNSDQLKEIRDEIVGKISYE